MPLRFTVELTRAAEADLDALHTYFVEHRSVEQADMLIEKMLEAMVTLEQFPSRGAIPKELQVLHIERYRRSSCFPTGSSIGSSTAG